MRLSRTPGKSGTTTRNSIFLGAEAMVLTMLLLSLREEEGVETSLRPGDARCWPSFVRRRAMT